MHGRPRNPSKPIDEAASAAKAEKLRLLQSQFLSFHQRKMYIRSSNSFLNLFVWSLSNRVFAFLTYVSFFSYTDEALELSAKLVELNPECYTAWNYRKLAFENNLTQSDSDPTSVKSILDEELRVVRFSLLSDYMISQF